ncbi:hypothetical protein [Pseudanabaena mucicola]|uniref:Uncharacterized protein n=1 Tax=Pseudanabaena mucicola FACHB-723 TaxID=2692860 RepID=A0ABR8A2Y1_9CYAN|nr:hypothetical protein [Pseudanabaena mucicola]MBD2190070.1 hypothetical protein [Pseudanabaena mucicola FACHB-723]
MALKIGKLEIGIRLLISLIAIAIAYGLAGAQLCTFLRTDDYLNAGLLFLLSTMAILAIPQSLGGLLAAIVAVIIVYWQSSNITYSLITAGVCLGLYLLNFPDLRYDPAPDKRLAIREIVATVITIVFMVAMTWLVLQSPANWLNMTLIGAVAAAITLVGKQLLDTGLSQKNIWKLFGIVTASSFAIGLMIRAIIYATTKPVILY